AGDLFQAAVSGDQEWLSFSLRRTLSPSQPNKQGLTVLHVAAQHGRLDCVKLLVEAYCVDVNASCPCGRRPLHMVLSPQSKPHSHTCIIYLLQHGAQHNSTDEGLTPLHMAAAEGLKNCVETLVEVGADTHAIDKHGHTPLDLARLWGHRVIAFLKNAMWQRDKKKEMEERKALQNLRHNLMWLYRTAESKEKSMLDLPHRGCTAKPGDSPWTEVAMHLAEELELGHY
uniref:Ankyrin repeat domain 53 n=1 Tax=Astyanax mexicanus TaxID=7994 RepID=W5KEF4_ASTMX